MNKKQMKDEPKYTVDLKMSVPRRVAHFLDWAALHHPLRCWSAPEVWQICMQLPRLPRDSEFNRKAMAATAGRSRSILQELYGRTLVTQRGIGFRASVGSEDVHDNCMPDRIKRAKSALGQLTVTAVFVDAKELPAHKRASFEAVQQTIGRLHKGKFLEQLSASLLLSQKAGAPEEGS